MKHKTEHLKLITSKLTTSRALMVVSSLLAATQPSSADPPSHMPANAAIDRAARKYMSRSPSSAMAGSHLSSSRSLLNSGSPALLTVVRYSGRRAYATVNTIAVTDTNESTGIKTFKFFSLILRRIYFEHRHC